MVFESVRQQRLSIYLFLTVASNVTHKHHATRQHPKVIMFSSLDHRQTIDFELWSSQAIFDSNTNTNTDTDTDTNNNTNTNRRYMIYDP